MINIDELKKKIIYRSKHKEALTKLRIKKLEEKMKMNLIKRKKNTKKTKNG